MVVQESRGGDNNNKNGKPLLFIIFIGLLALFNSVIGQRNVQTSFTAALFQPSFQNPATDSTSDNAVDATALDPSSFLDDNNNNNDTCIPQPNGPMSRVHFVTSGIPPVDKSTTTNGTTNTTTTTATTSSEAICLYDRTQPSHFPHAMQQLFGCLAFWLRHNKTNKNPVLIVDEEDRPLRKKLVGHPVTRNFVEMMQSQMSLQIVKPEWLEEKNNNNNNNNNSNTTTGIHHHVNVTPHVVPLHAYDVRSIYKELDKLTKAHFHFNDTSSWTCTKSKPRIGILNRQANTSFRSMLNAEQIANHSFAKGLSRDNHIPVGYFEDLEFRDQVAFFRSVDILISPHGAQLTGVVYMDAPCSQLLEVFPKHYVLPYFFGSLAMTSGTKYSYLYLSNNSFLVEQAMNKYERKILRKVNLCPSIPMILGYLQKLVVDWNKCCSASTMQSK